MRYEEVMNRLSEMRSRFDEGFSPSDRLFLREMSVAILGKPVRNTSCKDCYRDAFIEISCKLKRLGAMPKEKKFYLRAGVLLHFGGEMYVNENLTDDIAMDALNDNFKRRDLFQKVPDNLAEVLAARKALKAEQQTKVEGTSKDELLKQIEGLKAVNAEKTAKLNDAEKFIETLKAENGEAIEKAKAEAQAETAEKAKAEAQAEADRLNGIIAEKEAAIAAKDAEIEELKKQLAEKTAKAEEPAPEPAKEAPAEAAAEAPAAEAPKTAKPAAKK